MRTFKFFTIPILTVLFFFGGMALLSAQIPGIPYQAYIQNKDAGFIPGEQYHDIPLAMADILLEFDIVNSKGVVEYTERITARTDKFGLVNTVIGVGSGTVTYADFDNIDWDGLKKTMNIRIDMTGTGAKFEPHGEIDLVNIPSKTFTGMTTGKGAPTASFPANPTAGHVYVDETTGLMYAFDGNNWVKQFGVVDGLTTGPGAPTPTNPTNPQAGDVYIDESTGNVYTYDGTTWVNQTIGTVTTLADNNDGTYTYTSEDGTTTSFAITQSGTGDPTTAGVTGAAGDVYVDESTGDIYTHDGTGWEVQTGIVSKGTGDPITTGVTGEAGDVYIDESTGNVYTYDGTTWVKQTVADAMTTSKGIVQLAGDLGGTGVTGTPVVAPTQASAPIVGGLQGVPISTNRPVANQVLAYDGTSWKPTNPTVASGGDNLGDHVALQDIIMGTHGIQDGASTPTTGATGQILSSTGTGTLWVYPAGTSVEKTADYTIVDEGTVYVKPSAAVTITLPDPSGKDGKRVTVKRADDATVTANTLTVTTTVGNIDGVSNVSLNMGFQAFTFEAYNNAWRIVNRF